MTSPPFPCRECLVLTVCRYTCDMVREYKDDPFLSLEWIVKNKACCYCSHPVTFSRKLHNLSTIHIKCTVCKCLDLIRRELFTQFGGHPEDVILE